MTIRFDRLKLSTIANIPGAAQELDIAKRADALRDPRDNSARTGTLDGYVAGSEIDLLLTPDNSSVLFPQEKVALARLAQLFKLPEQIIDVPGVRFKGLSFVADAPPAERASLAIAELAEPLRTAARRVQLAFDDGDPDHITPSEIRRALDPANVARFTDESVQNLQKLASLLQMPPSGAPTGVVAELQPFEDTRVIFESHGVSVAMHSTAAPHWNGFGVVMHPGRAAIDVKVAPPNRALIQMRQQDTVVGPGRAREFSLSQAKPDEVVVKIFGPQGNVLRESILRIPQRFVDTRDDPAFRGAVITRWRGPDGRELSLDEVKRIIARNSWHPAIGLPTVVPLWVPRQLTETDVARGIVVER